MKNIITTVLIAVTLYSCTSTVHLEKKVYCQGKTQQGDCLVQSTGVGKNNDTGQISAIQNALYSVIFVGIETSGSFSCPKYPLFNVNENKCADCKAKIEGLISSGELNEFITSPNNYFVDGQSRVKTDGGYRLTYTLIVDRDRLRKFLENKNLIMPL